MSPSTIGALALVVFAFGLGPLGWLVLPLVAITILGALLYGEIAMSNGRLDNEDDRYHAARLEKSKQSVRDSLTVETPHTEGH